MIQIDELAKLLDPDERAMGAPSLAHTVGATHLCLFIRDPELDKFLPGPGFPQKLPGGIDWLRYLQQIAESGNAHGRLRSPFYPGLTSVFGFHLNANALVVLFGDGIHGDAPEVLAPSLSILAALLIQEVRTDRAQSRAQLSQEVALESRRLARSLSEALDQLAASFHARESLLQEVRNRDRRLQLARRISGIGVWEFHVATGKVYLAPETAAIYGYPVGEFVGSIETIRSRIHPDDQAQSSAEMNRALTGADDYNVQFRVMWPNGIVRWVEERGMVLGNTDNASPTVVGFTLDITQRIMTEEALIRSEKLAAAGRLAASIAHEINNPLESLVNLVYLAQSESDLNRVRELLTVADSELTRISAVARTSLGFYREGTTPVRFDISLTVQQVVELFNAQIVNRGVRVKQELSAEETEIEGWPGEIKQAVSNLLINALHASKPSTSIRIRVKRVGTRVQLSIADNGHGISRGHLARIFEPFFTTKNESGTGLGLWTTKQIVEKHGGTIMVRSTTGEGLHGTVFLLSFAVAGGARLENPEESLRYRWLKLGM